MPRGQKLALLARDAYIRSVQGERGNFIWQHIDTATMFMLPSAMRSVEIPHRPDFHGAPFHILLYFSDRCSWLACLW